MLAAKSFPISRHWILYLLAAAVLVYAQSTSAERDDLKKDLHRPGNNFSLGLTQLGMYVQPWGQGPLTGDGSEQMDVYQDAFCMLNSAGSWAQWPHNDSRFALHSFAILHGRLYIFSATAIYNVSLDAAGPPFSADTSLSWTDFSEQLSNLLYSTPWTVSRIFTTVGIELDHAREMLLVGFEVNAVDFVGPNNEYDVGGIPHAEQMRDGFILRDRFRQYQDPEEFDYEFSAHISDDAYYKNPVTLNATRFISAEGYFFAAEIDPEKEQFYLHRFEVKPHLAITIKQYFVYRDQSKRHKWLLSPAQLNQSGLVPVLSASESVFVKNGFIRAGHMYLAQWEARTVEVYSVAEPSTGPIEVTFERAMWSREFVQCHIANHDLGSFHAAVWVTLVLLCALVFYIVLAKRDQLGHRFLLGPDLALYELNDVAIYSKKFQ